jgi:hypothetical protein
MAKALAGVEDVLGAASHPAAREVPGFFQISDDRLSGCAR